MVTQEMIRVDDVARAPEQAAVPREKTIVLPWQRLGLGAVLILAAVLDFWQLDRIGYGNTYYAAAIRSMLQSWHNFFYNAFDPGGFVTIDKLPLGFWLQAASAKLFGYGGLSLMAPQALAGVLSVAVLYRLVARAFGAGAGLLAALALALMPVNVAANRNNIIDSTLVLVILLGAWAVLRAAETGRLRWLLLCAVLVGLGFNVKMLEAYLVVPAFGLLYLLAAPLKWPARIGRLAVATVVLLAVSLSWAVAVDLTPASQRPYVGSSGTNSVVNLAFGYNGLERLTGRIFGGGRGATNRTAAPAANARPATGTGTGAGDTQQANAGGFTRGESGNPSPVRLFNSALGGQVSWLLPLAILGLVAAAWRTRLRVRPRFELDRRQQSLVLWGMWLLTGAAFFSVAGFFHSYYMVTLAPSIAALAGIGVVSLWRDYRNSGWRGWALPVALLVTAAVQAYMLSSYPDWSRWLTPLVVGLCLVAAAALVLARLGVRLGLRAGFAAALLGVAALLAAPAAWAADTVASSNGGGTPTAGPRPQGGAGGFPGATARGGQGAGTRYGNAGGRGGFGGFGGFGGRDNAAANTGLVRYLEAHQGGARYLLATASSMSAAPIIISTGKPVMALGGFSGADRIVTPGDLSRLVSNGTVRYFLEQAGGRGSRLTPGQLEELSPQAREFLQGQGGGRGGFGGFGGGGNADLTQWVSKSCAAVPASQWQGVAATGAIPGAGAAGGGQQLYDCGSRPAGQSSSSSPSSATPANPSTPATPATPSQGQTGQASSTGALALAGRLVAGAAGAVTVQSFQGQQSLPATSSTRYYLAVAAATGDLAVGERVAVAPDRSDSSAARSVTIASPGSPYVSVRSSGFGAGGAGGPGSAPRGAGGSGGYGGPGGGSGYPAGAGGVRRAALTGTITAVQGGSITFKTAAGVTRTLRLISSTTVYRVTTTTRGGLQPGQYVAVRGATAGGRQVATDVVGSSISGAVPSIVPTGASQG